MMYEGVINNYTINSINFRRGDKRINTSHGVSKGGQNMAQKLRMSQINPTTQKIQTSQNFIARPRDLVSSNEYFTQHERG